jgi:hypothetical protein
MASWKTGAPEVSVPQRPGSKRAERLLVADFAREHVGKRARVAAEIVDREVAPVQHRT